MCFFVSYTMVGQISTGQTSTDCGNSKGGQELLSVINNQSSTTQSSTHSISNNFAVSDRAIDGVKTGTFAEGKATKTDSENTPWWEVQLDDVYALESIKLYYPTDVYPNGISNIYILTSTTPFSSTNLASEISSPMVKSIHIEGAIPNGTSIPLDFNSAQFIRIQYDGEGVLSLLEVDLPGTNTEICGNGKDDDCDGKIDCEDSDCAPTFLNVEQVNPSCPICDDGEIRIQYSYKDNSQISVSIYGEENLSECVTANDTDPACLFENLSDGEYNLFISNGSCTIEYPNNPVTLSSPPGIVTSHCENGGFENGDFTRWEGRYGLRSTGFTDFGFPSGRFSILSSGQDDNVPISYPFLGDYCVRLGDDRTGEEQESLKYCFTVDEENADFGFYYALVMEDPDHDPVEAQPYFQYTITHIQDGIPTAIPNGTLFLRSNVENPLFLSEEGERDPIAYTNWDCAGFDLSQYIGEEVCIEFITAHCSGQVHYSYCYIDGICASNEDALPIIELNIESNIICKNQETIIDGSNSRGFNNKIWEVCELDQNNAKINCVTQESISSVLGFFNVGDFYSSMGENFECGNSYSVNLTLANNCSEPVSEEVIIQYICEENNFNYKDILICGSESVDVTIQGNNDCGGECTYEWTPQTSLNSTSIEFPTIQGTINFNAFREDKIVNIKTPEGCNYREEVNILNFAPDPFELILIEDEDFCTYNLQAKVSLVSAIHSDLVTLIFENLRTGEEFDGVLVSETGVLNRFIFQLPETIDKSAPDTYFIEAFWDISSFEPDDFIILGGNNCSQSTTYTPPIDDTYFGDIIFDMPNNLVPASPIELNRTFGPIVLDVLNHNIYRGKLRIWDRFNPSIVWDKELFSTFDTPFDMNELHWDGTNEEGQLHLSDVFMYDLELENCDGQSHASGDFTLIR